MKSTLVLWLISPGYRNMSTTLKMTDNQLKCSRRIPRWNQASSHTPQRESLPQVRFQGAKWRYVEMILWMLQVLRHHSSTPYLFATSTPITNDQCYGPVAHALRHQALHYNEIINLIHFTCLWFACWRISTCLTHSKKFCKCLLCWRHAYFNLCHKH